MNGTAIDRMFEALARGDIGAARETCTPDVRIWHSYDRVALSLDDITLQWEALVAGSEERFITDVRFQATADGGVQQHLFVMRPKGGARKAWPVCVVVRFEGDRIARLDEYIDRAGAYAPDAQEPLRTPGF